MDIMFATSTYVVLLMLFIAFWNNMVRLGAEQQSGFDLNHALSNAAGLVFSQGHPTGWYLAAAYDPVSIPGILDSSGALSSPRLARLSSINSTNYEDVREALGVGEYQVFINTSDGHQFGPEPEKGSTTATLERTLFGNGNATTVMLWVWK